MRAPYVEGDVWRALAGRPSTDDTWEGDMFGMWYGGANYAPGYIADDLEVFASKADARRVGTERRFSVCAQEFRFADGPVVNMFTPNVDSSSEIHLYFGDPRDAADPYPDVILSFGPRGGVVERVA